MLFPDIELGARIEASEASLLKAIIDRPGRDEHDEHAFHQPFAGGIAGHVEPGSPMNKVAGIGFNEPPDGDTDATLHALEHAYAERRCPIQFEVSTLADPQWLSYLSQRGYLLVGIEDVVGFDLTSATIPEARTSSDLSIRISTDDEIEAWVELSVEGFATPDDQGVLSSESFPRDLLGRAMTRLVHAPGFVRYIVERNGMPAAAGCICHASSSISHMCGAATLPTHRRRGAQSLLLRQRLQDARAVGGALAVMTTSPGSKSQQNAIRAGFTRLYSRVMLVRELT